MLRHIFEGKCWTVADVIHTVGPQGENSSKLKDCYNNCFKQMLNLGQKSVVSQLWSASTVSCEADSRRHGVDAYW